MSALPSPKHPASWAGQCPRNDQSAGRPRSGKSRHRSKWLDWPLEEAAMSVRSKNVYLAANRTESGRGAATRKPSARSSTRSPAPVGTYSRPVTSTTTSAATTTNAATPNARPDVSSASSTHSATPSSCRRPPERYFLSVFLAGEAGDPRRVKMVEDGGVVPLTSRFPWCFEPVVQFDVGASPGSRACRCERAP
jgi:hypothetical protein